MQNTIKLKVHRTPKVSDNLLGTIRITPEAEAIIKQISRETGLSGRSVVSQIVIQAEPMIEIVEV
jgi:hypothetical protein